MKRLFLILFFMLIFLNIVFGYEPGGVRFLTENYGQQSFGMGGAFTAVCDDTAATFYNPAGLIFIDSIEIELSSIALDLDRDYLYLGYAEPIKSSTKAVFGISILQYSVNNIRGFDDYSYELGNFDILSQEIILSLGYITSKYLAAGFSLKSINENYWLNRGDCLSFDLSLLYLAKNMNIGLIAKDISASMSWESGYNEKVPFTIRLGAAYFQSEYLTYSLDVERRTDEPIKFFMGGRYKYRDFYGTMGFGDGLFSIGLGGYIHVRNLGDFVVGYTYRTEKEGFSAGHSIGLSFIKLPKKITKKAQKI